MVVSVKSSISEKNRSNHINNDENFTTNVDQNCNDVKIKESDDNLTLEQKIAEIQRRFQAEYNENQGKYLIEMNLFEKNNYPKNYDGIFLTGYWNKE